MRLLHLSTIIFLISAFIWVGTHRSVASKKHEQNVLLEKKRTLEEQTKTWQFKNTAAMREAEDKFSINFNKSIIGQKAESMNEYLEAFAFSDSIDRKTFLGKYNELVDAVNAIIRYTGKYNKLASAMYDKANKLNNKNRR